MDDTKEWNLQTHSNRLLELPHDLLLRILQLLPMKTVYEACLVHREAILPEARSVLWEAPRFRSGTRASQFLNIVRSSKRHALLVRSLYLCVLEKQDPMFPIVSKSSLTLHQQQNTNSLSDPKLILLFTKACEKITSLTFYSDNIESSHLAQVAATAIHLSSLTLIGSKIKEAPYIKGFLSRIQSITLDGKFIISDDWATQMSRATHLTSLQISLSGIAIPVLEKLCRNVPLLTDLTLTDASNFQDRDVQIVTGFFPNLESFTLQGTVHVTEVALFAALSSCSELEHLKLRANVNTNGTPADSLERYGMPPDHIVIYLQTLVLENIMMDDRWFLLMSSKLHHLKYVGLKSCPHLTDTSVGALLKECPQINTFYVEDCIGVSLGVFSNQMASLLSLRRLSFISSGALTTSDIYQLCATGKLLYFYVTATPQLKNSVLAEKINSNNVLELNKEDMIQMAQSKESALTLPNRVHVLTHEHVSQLAKRLNLSLRALETILDDITGRNEILSIDNSTLDYDGYSNVNNNNNNKSSNKNINNNNNSNTEDDDQDEEDTHHSSPTKFSDISDNSFISQDWLNEFDDKRASETEGAYSDSDDNNDNNDNNDSDDDAYNEQPSAKGDGAFPDWESQGDCLSGLNDWPNQTKGNGDASSIQEWPGNDWLNQDNSCESLTEQDHDGGGDLIAGLWEEQHHGNKKWQSNSDENDSSGSVEDKETNGRVIKEEWALKQHNDNIPTLWDWQSQINNNDTTNNTNASMSNGDH
ncbi:RNI-like protein, partial [Backusella circina FSU 941]